MLNNNIDNRLMSKKHSGMILMSALWMVAILLILVLSLSRQAYVEMALSKNILSKTFAHYSAVAGVAYALRQIQQDDKDEDAKLLDTHYACAVKLDQKSLEEVWKDVELNPRQGFRIYYEEGNSPKQRFWGLADEERKININGLRPQDVPIIKALLTEQGVEEELAQTVSASIIDWSDGDSLVTDNTFGAEDDYYQIQNSEARCKNAPFDVIEELLLVRGVDQEIFNKLKAFVTIFPTNKELKVNFQTASELVLRSLALSAVGAATNTDREDALSLVEKILEARAGSDGFFHTEDDGLVEEKDLVLNAKEKVLFYYMMRYQSVRSIMIRMNVEGYDFVRKGKTVISAVVDRDQGKILEWQRK